MQFHPSGEREFKTYKPIGCKRCKVSRKIGTFVGSFRIVGEGEFTTAEGAKLAARWDHINFMCRSSSEGSGNEHHQHPHPPLPRFPTLEASTPNDRLEFSALSSSHPRFASFTAIAKESSGPLKIFRFVGNGGSASSFAVGPHLRRATVTPPAPFSGSAIFQRQGESKPPLWSGSLAVSFPGKPDVPLTGPSFTSVFLR